MQNWIETNQVCDQNLEPSSSYVYEFHFESQLLIICFSTCRNFITSLWLLCKLLIFQFHSENPLVLFCLILFLFLCFQVLTANFISLTWNVILSFKAHKEVLQNQVCSNLVLQLNVFMGSFGKHLDQLAFLLRIDFKFPKSAFTQDRERFKTRFWGLAQ